MILLGIVIPEEYKERSCEYAKEILKENNVADKYIESMDYLKSIAEFSTEYFCQIEEAQISVMFNKNKKLIDNNNNSVRLDHIDFLYFIEEDFKETNVDEERDMMMIVEIRNNKEELV